MPPSNIKEEAQRFIQELPDDATWDDLIYRIYVRQSIEAGLKDSEAGRTVEVKELRKKLNLVPDVGEYLMKLQREINRADK